MKLFDDFEAVKFPEENLIFITKRGYLYYLNVKIGESTRTLVLIT